MVACVSIERRRGKNRSRLEHRIVVFKKTEKKDRKTGEKKLPKQKFFNLTKNKKKAYLPT